MVLIELARGRGSFYSENLLRHSLSLGCVAAVGNRSGFMYTQSLGSFTYGEPVPVTHNNPSMSTDVRHVTHRNTIHNTLFPRLDNNHRTLNFHHVWSLNRIRVFAGTRKTSKHDIIGIHRTSFLLLND